MVHYTKGERLINVDSGWDYVTLRVRPEAGAGPEAARRGARAAARDNPPRHRRSFSGAVTACGAVQLERRRNFTA